MFRLLLVAMLSVSIAAASVVPTVSYASTSQANSDRELLRLIQIAIRDEINEFTDEYRSLSRDLAQATTREEKRAIRLAIRPIRSQIRRLTNRLRLSRRWNTQRIRYWSRIYVPSDVSPA